MIGIDCEGCGEIVKSKRVQDYSIERLGKVLCMACQTREKQGKEPREKKKPDQETLPVPSPQTGKGKPPTSIPILDALHSPRTPEARTVMPAVSVDEAVAFWKQYEDLKSKLATPSDIQQIEGQSFLKKSFWRKLATCFNLSDEIVEKEISRTASGNIVRAEYIVRCTAPNGRSSVGIGIQTISEYGGNHPEHDIPATAHTRAKNRAISDLVGGGEGSAEEVR